MRTRYCGGVMLSDGCVAKMRPAVVRYHDIIHSLVHPKFGRIPPAPVRVQILKLRGAWVAFLVVCNFQKKHASSIHVPLCIRNASSGTPARCIVLMYYFRASNNKESLLRLPDVARSLCNTNASTGHTVTSHCRNSILRVSKQ